MREALQKLEQDEMLVVHPRKGIEFIQISPEQQLQLLEVRRYIEPICIQFATRRSTPEQKKRMLELGDTMLLCSEHQNDVEHLQCLQEIHALLCEATNNPYFRHTLRRIQAFSRRFWFVNKIESDSIIGSKIHWHILRAIAFGNEKEAVYHSGQLMEHLIEATFRKITLPNDSK